MMKRTSVAKQASAVAAHADARGAKIRKLSAKDKARAALVGEDGAFKALDDGKTDLAMAKLTYVAMNLLGLAMGMYKCATMGLLPLTSSDWVRLLGTRPALEYSGGAVPLGT